MNFKQIIEIQYSLNDQLAKKTWLNDPKVNMYQAILDEAVTELTVSAGWKPWWKKTETLTDIANCKLEIVDILHFHIGAALQEAMYEVVLSYSDFSNASSEDPKLIKFLEAYPSEDAFDRAWKSGENFVFYTDLERDLVIEELANDFETAFFSNAVNPDVDALKAIQDYTGALLVYGARDSLSNLADLASSF